MNVYLNFKITWIIPDRYEVETDGDYMLSEYFLLIIHEKYIPNVLIGYCTHECVEE